MAIFGQCSAFLAILAHFRAPGTRKMATYKKGSFASMDATDPDADADADTAADPRTDADADADKKSV